MTTDSLTKPQERELHALARAINDREKTIQALKGQTVEHANRTLTEAILQGQDLLKVKAQVPHGMWLDWLKVHTPLLDPRMAQRYMRVAANPTRVANAGSLREALLLCEENGTDEPSAAPKRWSEDLQALKLFNRAVQFIGVHPMDKFPPETREELKRDLEPVAAVLWPEKFAVEV